LYPKIKNNLKQNNQMKAELKQMKDAGIILIGTRFQQETIDGQIKARTTALEACNKPSYTNDISPTMVESWRNEHAAQLKELRKLKYPELSRIVSESPFTVIDDAWAECITKQAVKELNQITGCKRYSQVLAKFEGYIVEQILDALFEQPQPFKILTNRVCASIQNMCEALYEESGASSVYDYANKIGLVYHYCKPCDAQTPTISS